MIGRLLTCIAHDLEAWAPGLEPGAREETARRLATRLGSRPGSAEQRMKDGSSLSWIFDGRSGQLLVTYPNGSNRIRVVAPPQA